MSIFCEPQIYLIEEVKPNWDRQWLVGSYLVGSSLGDDHANFDLLGQSSPCSKRLQLSLG